MAEDTLLSQQSFFRRIERSNWKQHLDSHHLLICEFKQFLEPFQLSLFADRFMGLLRFRCFEIAGAGASIEELQIDFQAPDYFSVKIALRNSQGINFFEHTFTVKDILGWLVSAEPLLKTKRLEISLLLPSEEPEIIDFIKERDMWKMRGKYYSPLVNIHSIYQSDKHEVPWYRYFFVLRLRQSKKPIGFIGFDQNSPPSLITPLISQIPYETVILSYGLSKYYWGQGLMSESLLACVPWFVVSQAVQELVGVADINNRASRRILQKLGLQESGLLQNPMISADLKDMYKFLVYKKRYVGSAE